ncbi:hypothetical protein [Lentzea sp. NBRC 102530]|uniref:hypothetical protein n=1 Tax=Lentzea sp. NBRC 102530 TaxID=3032201 RepID=UPI002557988C|nr:hypothetical protein [Lentzea sp. NBRC 102530]
MTEDDYDTMWAADVCLASRKFDPRLPAAMNGLRQLLIPPLTELAEQVGLRATVGCRAYVRLTGISRNEWKRMTNSYVRNIYDRAVMALMRPDKEWYDSEVGIHWLPNDAQPNSERVTLHFYDPFIYEGFRFSKAVHLKLTNQLPRARAAGYPTLLILDQKSPRYVDWTVNIAPEPLEIGEGIAFLVANRGVRLDACVLVNHDDSIHEIYHTVGNTCSSN